MITSNRVQERELRTFSSIEYSFNFLFLLIEDISTMIPNGNVEKKKRKTEMISKNIYLYAILIH